jgi:hypothetical protein
MLANGRKSSVITRCASAFLFVALVGITLSRALLAVDEPAENKRDGDLSAPAENDQIVWGRSARPVQLGWRIEPKKEIYAAGDIVRMTLFLRNAGQERISTAMPNLEVLEKLGLNLGFHDADGEEIPWSWGPAHQGRDKLTVSGAVARTLEPNVAFELPSFQMAIGAVDDLNASKKIMAQLDVKPGQGGRLIFKLSSIGIARGDEAQLESADFNFRVAEANTGKK